MSGNMTLLASVLRFRSATTILKSPLCRSLWLRNGRGVAYSSTANVKNQRQQEQDDAAASARPMDMAFAPVNDFHMNQYAVACTQTKQAAIIDCGASSSQELGVFLHWLQENNYQLTTVWQTHAHLDHVAGLGLLRAEYEEIPIHMHVKERDIYNSFDQRKKDFGFQVERDGNLPPDTEISFFDDTQKFMKLGALTFHVFSTPGHSPGHVGFYESLSKSFFGGDFIMQGSIGRTDFPTSSPEDMNTSLETFVQNMDDDVVIFSGHGPATTLKREKQVNPFLQAYSNYWGGA